MQFIYFYIFVVAASGSADQVLFNDPNMPIRVVDTSAGQDNRQRIDHLYAEIYPRHVTTRQRVNFPRSGPVEELFRGISAQGDQRGHLVASQFSGPPRWYNLSPQNSRVNRNRGYQSITTDWYGTECEVREFLQQGGNRYVTWTVDMSYIGNSNRPNEYHLRVNYIENGSNISSIDTRLHNPFLTEASTFWICSTCRSNRHEHDELRRRGLIEEGCSQFQGLHFPR